MQIRSRITANPFVTILGTASGDLRIGLAADKSDGPEKKGKGERESLAGRGEEGVVQGRGERGRERGSGGGEGTPFRYELLTRNLINACHRDAVRTPASTSRVTDTRAPSRDYVKIKRTRVLTRMRVRILDTLLKTDPSADTKRFRGK